MNWESVFQVANQAAMAGWAVLVLAPRRWRPLQLLPAYIIPAALSLGYFVLVAVYFARADGGYSSLAAVGALFESEPVRLAGWVHYLALDLFIGGWIAREAEVLGVARIIQAPILVATFLFGPVGLLAFLLLRVSAGAWRDRPAGAAV